MEVSNEIVTSEILNLISDLETDLSHSAYLSYTDAGKLLDRNPSVIAQYAKAGLIEPIQQGPKKLICYADFQLLKVYLHVAKNFGCSYAACKLIGLMLKSKSGLKPQDYLNHILKLESKLDMKQEIERHVNSYNNRGIFQKQKNQESTKDL